MAEITDQIPGAGGCFAQDAPASGGDLTSSPDVVAIESRSVIYGLPFDRYLATKCVSKSALWTTITRSPAHARVEKEANNAMAMGSAVHCAVLEPDYFSARFARGPEDRRGTKWADFVARYGGESTPLTSGDYDNAVAIRDAIRSHPLARKLIDGAHTEVSAFATDEATGLRKRIRPDAINTKLNICSDLKTTRDARAPAFRRNVMNFGYHAQQAMYCDTWAEAFGVPFNAFVFLVVETEPPYGVAIYETDAEAVEQGRRRIRQALDLWARCVESGQWPAYATTVQPLSLPKWAIEEE